jgi:DNA-binding CsgD family transcriptional regulator
MQKIVVILAACSLYLTCSEAALYLIVPRYAGFVQESVVIQRVLLLSLAGFFSAGLLFPLIMPLPGRDKMRKHGFLFPRIPRLTRFIVCILPFVLGRFYGFLNRDALVLSPVANVVSNLNFCWQAILGFGLFFLVAKMDKNSSGKALIYSLAVPFSIGISMLTIYFYKRGGGNPAAPGLLTAAIRFVPALLDLINFVMLFILIFNRKKAEETIEKVSKNSAKNTNSNNAVNAKLSIAAPVFRLVAALTVFYLIGGLYDTRVFRFFDANSAPPHVLFILLTLLGTAVIGYLSVKKTCVLLKTASSAAAIFFILVLPLLFSHAQTSFSMPLYSLAAFGCLSVSVSMPWFFSEFPLQPFWHYLLMSAVYFCWFPSFFIARAIRRFTDSQETVALLASALAILFYFLIRNLRLPSDAGSDNQMVNNPQSHAASGTKPTGSIRSEIYASCKFSRREQEIAELLLQGLTRSKIAGRIFIAEDTVKFHISHIYKKLGVNSRAEFFARLASGEEE